MSRNNACFLPGGTRNFFGTSERADASGGGHGNWGIVVVSGGGEGWVGGSGVAFVAGGGGAVAGVATGGGNGAGAVLITVGAQLVSSNTAMRQIAPYHGFLCMGHPTRLFWPCNRYNLTRVRWKN